MATVKRPESMVQDSIPASVQSSLNRLLVCSRIRQLINKREPVTVADLGGMRGSMLKLAYRSGLDQVSRPKGGGWRRSLTYLALLVLVRWRFVPVKSLRGIIGALRWAYRQVRSNTGKSPEITGHVTSTDKEGPMIRVCMLLWGMGRFGECVELLIRRVNSGRPDEQARQWLSLFLREIGEKEAADAITPPIGQPEAAGNTRHHTLRDRLSPVSSSLTRLKYGIVMSTMFDSDVFRASLLSLVDSDFQGEIVVVEDGYQPERLCESFCAQLPVRYCKRPDWEGAQATAANLGIEQLAPETDIVIYAHSDVLFPPNWFGQLNHAWEEVFDLGKVGIINLGYIESSPALRGDVAMREAFARRRYDDLLWVLAYPGSGLMIDVHSHNDVRRLFGLARCRFNDKVGHLRLMTGRFSPVASFPLQTWRDMGGFDPALAYAMDSELHYYGYQNRKWTLWINNTPLIHLQGTDTIALLGEDIEQFMEKERAAREAFEKKYGWDLGHFIFTYFAETSIIHHDEIVNAANELRFSDVDFVFDDFWERLRSKRLATCELYWCQSRATCKYV